MSNNHTFDRETFIDRDVAIALFDYVLGRKPDQPWPLLPILTFIAPSGGGKLWLIKYLHDEKCSLPGGHAAIPHAYLNFTLPKAPKDLLEILCEIRNQLQEQVDGQGNHMTFPRFDLGATIALKTPTDRNLLLQSRNELLRKLAAELRPIQSFVDLGNIGRSAAQVFLPPISPIISLALAMLKPAIRIPPVLELILRLQCGPAWKWYQSRSTDLELHASATIGDVLWSLFQMSRRDNRKLVESLLPAAFFADLREALAFDSSAAPKVWSKTTNVVIFLYGYETFPGDLPSESTADTLLKMLTLTEHRKQGGTDPLLVVIGAPQRPHDLDEAYEDPSFEQQTTKQDKQAARGQARELYQNWQQNIAKVRERAFPRLGHLYLPLWLYDFGPDYAVDSLSKHLAKKKLPIPVDDQLIQAIGRATYGQPLALGLAADIIEEAWVKHKKLLPEEFSKELYKRLHIEERFLSKFLSLLSGPEHKDLKYCAVPRVLDIHTLMAVLDWKSDTQARDLLDTYRRYSFTRVIDDEPIRIVFHPLVSTFLQQELTRGQIPGHDYREAHSRLRDFFASSQLPSARVEAAYHEQKLRELEPVNPFPSPSLRISSTTGIQIEVADWVPEKVNGWWGVTLAGQSPDKRVNWSSANDPLLLPPGQYDVYWQQGFLHQPMLLASGVTVQQNQVVDVRADFRYPNRGR